MAKSQKQQILEYLKVHGAITVKEATFELGITQPATRIKELIEDDGEPISRDEWKTVTRKNGTETEVRVYRYHGSAQTGLFGTQPEPAPQSPRYGSPV